MPIFRVRTGCLSCRRRKKKCCETKPVCRGCARNKLSCQWPSREEMARPRGPQKALQRSVQGSSATGYIATEPASTAGHIDQTISLQETTAHSTVSPCTNSTSPGSEASPVGSFREWPQPIAVSPGGFDMDLGGMIFDLDFSMDNMQPAIPSDLAPIAGTGTNQTTNSFILPETADENIIGLDDLPPDEGVIQALESLDTTTSMQTRAPTLSSNPTTALLGLSLGLVPRSLSLVPDASGASLELLSHYLGVTTQSMDNGSGSDNPFIVQLVPLAFSSDLVLQLILTQSAVHRASRSLPDTSVVATQHYNQSLQLFQRSISNYNSEQSVELLTLTVGALIMCFVETAKGDINGTVFDHLMAARWLLLALLSQKATVVPNALRNFLIEYYVYTATLSLVSIDCRISSQSLLGEELEAHGRALVAEGYVGSLCGCWLELLLTIPTIFGIGRRFLATEDSDNAEQNSSIATSDDFAVFAATYNCIQNWKPSATVHPDVAMAGRVFQQAMVLYLYTALNSLSSGRNGCHAATLDTAIANGIGYLDQIPPTSRINTSLCWPIAVIGACVQREDQREVLRARLKVMFKAIGLGNIHQTAVLLEEVWAYSNADPWNICHVMQENQLWISFA